MAAMERRFSEPCKIVEIVRYGSYRLQPLDGQSGPYKHTYNVKDLKLYVVDENGCISSSEASDCDNFDQEQTEDLYFPIRPGRCSAVRRRTIHCQPGQP